MVKRRTTTKFLPELRFELSNSLHSLKIKKKFEVVFVKNSFYHSAKLCNGTNEVYRELCGCEPSCEYLGKLQKCPKVCRQDCFCAPGYYRDSNDGCVALYGCSISNETENMCRLPVVVGPCFGNIPRFSYNYLKERCEKFYWSGCGGNENHFKTEHECEGICGGVSECPLGIEVHRCSVDPCQVIY